MYMYMYVYIYIYIHTYMCLFNNVDFGGLDPRRLLLRGVNIISRKSNEYRFEILNKVIV